MKIKVNILKKESNGFIRPEIEKAIYLDLPEIPMLKDEIIIDKKIYRLGQRRFIDNGRIEIDIMNKGY